MVIDSPPPQKRQTHPSQECEGPLRHFFATSGTNLIIQGLTVVQGIVLARALGSEGRGQFAGAILWPTFFASLGSCGTTVALARRAAQVHPPGALERTAVRLALVTGLVTLFVGGLAQRYLLQNADRPTRLAAFVFLPFIFFNHIFLHLAAVDQGASRFSRYNTTRLILNPSFLIVCATLWFLGIRQPLPYVAALLGANILTAFARLALALPLYEAKPGAVDLKQLWIESLPFGVAALLGPAIQTADKALLFNFLGPEQLGIYMVALSSASIVNSVAAAGNVMVFSLCSRAGVGDGFDSLATMFRATTVIWVVSGTGLALLIPLLLPKIFGSAYHAGVSIAIILVPAAAAAAQAAMLEEGMRAQGKAFIAITGRLVGLATFLCLGLLLLKPFKGAGVALASLAAQTIILGFMIAATKSHFPSASLRRLIPGKEDARELYVRFVAQWRTGLHTSSPNSW